MIRGDDLKKLLFQRKLVSESTILNNLSSEVHVLLKFKNRYLMALIFILCYNLLTVQSLLKCKSSY